MWKEVALVAIGFVAGIGVSVAVMVIAESLHEVRNGISHLRDSIGMLTSSHNVLRNEMQEQTKKITTQLSVAETAPKVAKEPESDPEDDEPGGVDRSI